MNEVAWRMLTEQVSGFLTQLREEMLPAGGPGSLFSREALEGWLRLIRPVAPFNQFAAPLVGLAGMLLSLMLAGVAVSSLATLLLATLALLIVLTRVFGVSFELAPFQA